MQMITKEMLENGKDEEVVEGAILIKDFGFQTTKNGNQYIAGNLQSGKVMGYKIWNNSPAFSKIGEEGLVNQVCSITGKFNEFNGVTSVIINNLEVLNADISPFLESNYDGDKYLEALITFCEHQLSVKGMYVVNSIFFSDTELITRFKNEFAAMNHHDNCKSGLIAHTCKVLKLLNVVLSTYRNFISDENGALDPNNKDLLIIGALLHDIGKIEEMKYGVYIEDSFVTHRIIGLEFILKHKDLFVANYSEIWFKHLEAIIMQHHDEYGEHCKTVYSFIVHQLDEMDSMMSLIDQEIPGATMTPAGKTIKVHDRRLNLI